MTDENIKSNINQQKCWSKYEKVDWFHYSDFQYFIFISCSAKKDSSSTGSTFFELPVWGTIKPLMEKTEETVKKSDWEELLSTGNDIASDFIALSGYLEKLNYLIST